ncbi:uncharacterized protein LOC143895592 [Temnothorax americanus]|uniref:uncharacterized protein LOC143895592 n=1 Tax=Temnothorax americanus TaxID=1964332 RepID=UPI0040697FF2
MDCKECEAHVLEIAALKAEVQNLQRQLAAAVAAATEMTAPPVPPRLSLSSGSLSLPGESPSGPPSSGPPPSRPPPPPPPRPSSPQSSKSQLPQLPGPSQLEPFLSPGSTLPTRPKRWQNKGGMLYRGRRGGRWGGRGRGRGTRPVIINFYTKWAESKEQ